MPKFGMGRGLKDTTSPENLDFGQKLAGGLDSLFQPGPAEGADLTPPDGFTYLDPTLIRPNPHQPRRRPDQAALAELAASIREQGLIQPVVVRRVESGFELIAGERRWRAAQMAGLKKIPAVVKDKEDLDSLLLAVVENVQREDLGPLEEATAFHRMIDQFGLTQAQVAKVVGRDRSTVANAVRLLSLPAEVQQRLEAGEIRSGHARALLALPTAAAMIKAARTVAAKGLSVRQTETLVKRLLKSPAPPRAVTPAQGHLAALADRLRRRFGTKVEIKGRPDKGRIVFEYYSPEELDRLLEMLQK
jgi:ParB family chromosome partitioning protein